MVSAPRPDQELDRIRTAIIAARAKLANEASFDVARGYAPGLQQTLQLLEALEEDIRTAHDELERRIGPLDEPEPDGEESRD